MPGTQGDVPRAPSLGFHFTRAVGTYSTGLGRDSHFVGHAAHVTLDHMPLPKISYIRFGTKRTPAQGRGVRSPH